MGQKVFSTVIGGKEEELNSRSRWGDNYEVANVKAQRGNNLSVGCTGTLTNIHNINHTNSEI